MLRGFGADVGEPSARNVEVEIDERPPCAICSRRQSADRLEGHFQPLQQVNNPAECLTLGIHEEAASDRRAFAAARAASRRRASIASASGAPRTTASTCLQNSGSPLAARMSARNG